MLTLTDVPSIFVFSDHSKEFEYGSPMRPEGPPSFFGGGGEEGDAISATFSDDIVALAITNTSEVLRTSDLWPSISANDKM